MATIIHTVKLVSAAKDAIDGIHKYEDAIIGVEKRVASLEKSLAGDGMIQNAHNWTAAVAKLGGATDGLAKSEQLLAGVSKLTAAEKTRLNATVSQAIEKYAALGKVAPSAMVELERATRKAETGTGGLIGMLGKAAPLMAGVFSVGAVTGGVRALVQWADDLEEVSAGIGVNIEQLQRWQWAWNTTGSSAEAGVKAIQTMSEKLADGTAAKALGDLGLNLDAIRKMAPEEQFTQITSALAAVTDQSKFAADGADIFGKTWKSVGVSVKNGMQQAADGARVLTEEQIKNIARMQGRWEAFLQWLKTTGGAVLGGEADTTSPAAMAARNGGGNMWSSGLGMYFGAVTNPKVASAPASAIGSALFGATQAEIDALYKSSDALANKLTPAALRAAEALHDARVAALVSSIKWTSGMDVDRRLMNETALNAGSYFAGLPRGQWAAPLPTGFGSSNAWDADVMQALGFATWQGGHWGNLNTPPKGASLASTYNKYMPAVSVAGGLLVSALGDSKASGAIGGALSGAGTGAMIGSVVPGIGTAIGAGIGAIVGGISGLFKKSAAQKANEEANKQLDQLRAQMESMRGTAAQLGINLDGLWSAKGTAGLKQAAALVEQLNKAIEKDQKLISDLNAMAPGELLSRAIRTQIGSGTLTDESRAALSSFMTGQAGNLAGYAQQFVSSGASMTGATGQAMFYAGSAAAAQMSSQGMGLLEIAKQLGPTLGALSAGTGMSNPLIDLINQANNPLISPILDTSQMLGSVAASMQNLGRMDQKTFGSLTAGLSEQYNALLANNTAELDARTLMAGDLQKIWEIQQQTPELASGALAETLKKAEAEGLIGPKFMSPVDRQREATERLIKSMDALNLTMSGASTGTGGSSGAPNPEDHEKNWAPAPRDMWRGGIVGYYARGVFVPRGTDTVPAMLTPGEGVLSRRGMEALGRLNAGQATGTDGQTVTVYLDSSLIAREVVRGGPKEIKVYTRR